MTASYVIDASVAIKLVLAEPLSTEAHVLFAALSRAEVNFHVPDLFYVECANVLWKQSQRGNCTAEDASKSYSTLESLPLSRTASFELANDALKIALAHTTSAYDACYLALASRLGIALISADQKLVNRLADSSFQAIWLGSAPTVR